MESCKGTEFEDIKKVAYLSINDKEYADEIEINMGDDYEYKFEMNRLYIFKKKPVYPQNYKECCSVLGFNSAYDLNNIATHDVVYDYKLQNLYRLFICRNAYWKIAGKQMGLRGPWKPNWSDTNEEVYGIQLSTNDTNMIYHESASFTFPTEEILNEFCKNFKELIEQCKELL